MGSQQRSSQTKASMWSLRAKIVVVFLSEALFVLTAAERPPVKVNQKQADGYTTLGIKLFAKGDLKAAMTNFQKAVKANPNQVDAYSNMAKILDKQGDKEGAEENLRMVVSLHAAGVAVSVSSTTSTTTPSLAEQLMAAQGGDDAKAGAPEDANQIMQKVLEQAMQADPNGVAALTNLGASQQKMGDLDGAEDSFRKAIAADPLREVLHRNLGLLLQQKGQLKGAEKSYRRAIELNPRHSQSHASLGSVLTDRKAYSQAEASFKKSLALDDSQATPYHQLGLLYEKTGKLEQAEREYRTAISGKAGVDPGAYTNLGAILLKKGSKKEAEGLYQKAMEVAPAHHISYMSLGRLYMAEEDIPVERAVEMFRKAAELTDSASVRANAHNNVGGLLRVSEQWEEAEKSFKAAVQADPEHLGALYNLGSVLSQLGKVKEALEVFKRRVVVSEKQGVWPVRLSVANFNTNERARDEFAVEAADAKRWVKQLRSSDDLPTCSNPSCATLPTLASMVRSWDVERADEFPAALKAIRSLENTTQWTVRRWEECMGMGSGSQDCTYGITFFAGWWRVFEAPAVRNALWYHHGTGRHVTVGGSALGEQCLAATLAFGLPCVGYEILCESLVKDAKALAQQLGIADSSPSATYHCKDVTKADFAKTSVFLVNDQVFPQKVREKIWTAAAPQLPENSVVVSFKPKPDLPILEGRGVVEPSVLGGTSWSKEQHMHIFRIGAIEV
eukprot:TRINITY_DN10535_c0_g2_i1.p1 TRINITY_DN10535_c0_g2~~TRINITY_DN10535_c0_g2_i1.p1  ORF type:complete len:730 (-),score=229.67 TRINITY_DN10535_c0_g2_i1:83-2272(-)